MALVPFSPEKPLPPARITTVLFDLDDTLFDHIATSRAALAASTATLSWPRPVAFEELHRRYSELLEEIHPLLLAGRYTYPEARRLRFQRLLEPYQLGLTAAETDQFAAFHYEHYQRLRQPVPGAAALLEALKPRVRIGIVTNNRTSEQVDKLQSLRLSPFVDALITSEEVGVTKPDPRIYEVALQRLGARPVATVMVGDNWQADVLGALAVGICPLWLNRFGASRPLAHVAEITSLEPLAGVMQQIVG